MAKSEKKLHEPLFTVTRRSDTTLWQAIGIRAAAIVMALVVCGILTVLVTGNNPFAVFATMFSGAVGSNRIYNTVHHVALLLCVSLAVTPAFRMRFWNIGAEGQTLFAGLITAIVMLNLNGKVPTAVLVLAMTVGAIAGGALWAFIPAFFKAHWNTNETLFTLMMNYIAIQLVEFFLKIADKSGSNVVSDKLLGNGLPNLFGKQYLLNIVVVAVLTVLLYIYLRYSKQGYEIAVVGESENTARYVGINVKRVVIRTMILSGALCGVAGLLIVGGASHSIDSNIVGGRGFTAIMVAWLAKFNPLMMVLTTFLLVFLARGADEISVQFGLNKSLSDILTGIILFFIIGCEFFINYRVRLNRSVFRRNRNRHDETVGEGE